MTKNVLLRQSQRKYLTKVEKSSKTGQEKKSLISAFACFLNAIAKVSLVLTPSVQVNSPRGTFAISHCLPYFQIKKTKKVFTLDQLATTNSTHPHSPLPRHILSSQLAENLRRTFPSLGPLKKILPPPATFLHPKSSFP